MRGWWIKLHDIRVKVFSIEEVRALARLYDVPSIVEDQEDE